MLSYHNDPTVKAKYVARFAGHRAADEVVQKIGFDEGRGGFVGCTLDAYDPERFPIELGWPLWLAYLADTIFEGLLKNEAPAFGADLLAAVPVGVDLEQVRIPFLVALLRRNLVRLADNTATCADLCRNAIQGVIDWLESGGESGEHQAAARVARAAVNSARREAEETGEEAAWAAKAAAGAARAATDGAEEMAEEMAAAEAAEAAEWAAEGPMATWAAASTEEYQTQRDDLLSIIRSLEANAELPCAP